FNISGLGERASHRSPALLASGEPSPDRRIWKNRRNAVVTFQPQYFLHQIRRLLEVTSPTGRYRGDRRRAVLPGPHGHGATNLGKSSHRDSTLVLHTRNPIWEIDR